MLTFCSQTFYLLLTIRGNHPLHFEIFVNVKKDSSNNYTITYNLNKDTSTWEVVTVEKENGSSFYLQNNPQNIWSDGKNVYSTVNSSDTFSGGYYLLKTGTANIISTVKCK